MTIRAGLAAAALCAAGLACRDRGETPAQATHAPGAPSTAHPPAGQGAGQAPAPPLARGDRHARAAAASRARPIHEVVGTVVRAERGQVAIRPRRGREITLQLGPYTTVNGPGAAGQALAPGDEVRASFRGGDGDPPTALSVEVQRDPWTDHG